MMKLTELEAWEAIRRVFCKMFCPCDECHRRKRVTRVVTYRFKDVAFTAEGNIMLNLKDTDVPGTVTVSIGFKNAKGRPARVDGVPTWTASNPALIDSLTPAADGLSASFHVLDAIDASNLTVNADVDLGQGTKNVDFVDTVSVVPGEAVAADFAFSAVVPDSTNPPTPLPDTFADKATFDAAVAADTNPEPIRLDGIEVKAGTGTPRDRFTHSDQGGVIDNVSPTS